MNFIGPFAVMALLSVTDGDTFRARIPLWPDGLYVDTAVRIRGIDTPEMAGACAYEKSQAIKARERLNDLLDDGGIQLYNVSEDKYNGRVVAQVIANGQNVGTILIGEGLAKPYTGGKKASWCLQ